MMSKLFIVLLLDTSHPNYRQNNSRTNCQTHMELDGHPIIARPQKQKKSPIRNLSEMRLYKAKFNENQIHGNI